MSEIRGALELVRTRLNEFIDAAAPRPGDWVILSNIVDQSGAPYEAAKDKLVMTLANIKREDLVGTYTSAAPARPDTFAIIPPPLYVDLFVLFYANFADSAYREGLGVISRAISFFQRNPVFTHANLPGLDPAIDKLAFELNNLDTIELNQVVGMLGANYLPSVYYKVRMIPFRSDAMSAEVPAARKLDNPAEK
jgi:hypothetical protein